jgi:hypothetical protein
VPGDSGWVQGFHADIRSMDSQIGANPQGSISGLSPAWQQLGCGEDKIFFSCFFAYHDCVLLEFLHTPGLIQHWLLISVWIVTTT